MYILLILLFLMALQASTVQRINRFYDYPYKLFTGAGYRIMQSNGIVRIVISVASTFRYQLLVRFEPVPVSYVIICIYNTDFFYSLK